MSLPKKCIAISPLLFLALLFSSISVYAGVLAGTVTHVSGPLFAKKTDGALKILSAKSAVEQGDILVSEKGTYARIKFIDNSEITLRPNSQLKIDSFSFDEEKPEEDNAAFNLIKGGLRAITGLLGKRNNTRFALKTPTATIGIRGTTFIAQYVPDEEAAVASREQYNFTSLAAVSSSLFEAGQGNSTMSDMPLDQILMREVVSLQLAQNQPNAPGTGGLAAGLYVHVIDGTINLTNRGGSQSFAAGQFGYTASFVQPPVVVPANPGLQFTPPPAFSSSSNAGSSGNDNGKSNNVDCEVR